MIYLYGLQRSGTNVISEFLKTNYNITIVNKNVEKRDSIQHKHCRIYDNKKIIPDTNAGKQYYNNYLIDSIIKLDTLLGDKTNTNKYILVYKDIFQWLPSISKHAKSCNWKVQNKMDFIYDYKEFMKKWNEIKNERVLFISYTEYLNLIIHNDITLKNKIENFLNCGNTNKLLFPSKVNCSSVFTKEKIDYYVNKRYMNLYTQEEIEIIKTILNSFR